MHYWFNSNGNFADLVEELLCRNCNLTSDGFQISTRRPHTPDKRIRTLCHKCQTPKFSDGSHLSGKKEDSQSCVASIPTELSENLVVCKENKEAILKSSYWRDMFDDQGNPLFESRAGPNIKIGEFETHNYS